MVPAVSVTPPVLRLAGAAEVEYAARHTGGPRRRTQCSDAAELQRASRDRRAGCIGIDARQGHAAAALLGTLVPPAMTPEKIVLVLSLPKVRLLPAAELTLPAPASDPIACVVTPIFKLRPDPTETAVPEERALL